MSIHEYQAKANGNPWLVSLQAAAISVASAQLAWVRL